MDGNAVILDSEEKLFEKALESSDSTKIKKLISCGFYINQILTDLPPLSIALSKGRFDLVDLLVSSGADVCQVDASGKFCPMFYAIKNKCPQKVIRRLILAGAPINGVVEYNYRSTALHLAVFANQKSVIRCLLSLSADVSSRDINNMTPLHIAVQANHPKIVKMLVHKGAQLDAECCDKFTPLMLAIHDNSSELVELLISLGSNVNHEPEEPKYSFQKPLNYAAGLGHVEIMQRLLIHGADVKSTTRSGDSPLHSVAYSDKLTKKPAILDTIQILIKHGGDLQCYNNVGHNPLHSSIMKNTAVAKCLLKVGASVKTPTENNETPLHLAADVGNSAIVKLLLSSGADRAATNNLGLTPYDLCLKQADAQTVRIMWGYGQPYDDMGLKSLDEVNEGIRGLIIEQEKFFHAIEFGYFDKLVNALENGAEPKGSSLTLNHILHYSVFHGREKIVHELLERGVPVGLLDTNGETALHIACKLGYTTVCLNLLAHGACYNSCARCGKTPLEVAKSNRHHGVCSLLKFIRGLFYHIFDIRTLIEATSDVSEIIGCIDPTVAKDSLRNLVLKACLNCVNNEGHTLLSDSLSNGFNERAQMIMFHRLKYLKTQAFETEDQS